jgi:hypothetical protein
MNSVGRPGRFAACTAGAVVGAVGSDAIPQEDLSVRNRVSRMKSSRHLLASSGSLKAKSKSHIPVS